MIGIDWWQKIAKALIASLMTGVLLSLLSCGARFPSSDNPGAATEIVSNTSSFGSSGDISEASPPSVIQQLREALETYQPQVKILSPQADEVLQDNTVKVQLQVQDLPIFKNQELDMGPHVQVILDNQSYISVYDLNEPLVFPDLLPGTHTLRVFASRPWDESFKNEGAYAQTTFHIFTKTQDNNPDTAQPLLTYSHPEGRYGAEPILLDFYLTNAPLHLVAQENSTDEIADWRIRCTINGNSFVIDRWESLYLKGFKPGKNWVQLEFLDEQGNPVKNVFNNTVRLITYEPKGKDTLSKLVRGEVLASEARGIVDSNFTTKIPVVLPTPAPLPSPTPSVQITPDPQPSPQEETTPQVELPPSGDAQVESKRISPREELTYPVPSGKQKPSSFLSRFRRPSVTPSPDLPPMPDALPRAPELVPPELVPQPDSAQPD